MGFHRQGQPTPLDRTSVTAVVAHFFAEEVALASTVPQRVAPLHDCLNPAGHDYRAACGSIACVHCARVAWA